MNSIEDLNRLHTIVYLVVKQHTYMCETNSDYSNLMCLSRSLIISKVLWESIILLNKDKVSLIIFNESIVFISSWGKLIKWAVLKQNMSAIKDTNKIHLNNWLFKFLLLSIWNYPIKYFILIFSSFEAFTTEWIFYKKNIEDSYYIKYL